MNTITSVAIDARKLLLYKRYNFLSHEDMGAIMDSIAQALQDKKFDLVKQYPFTGRIIMGAAARPAIPTDVRKRVLSVGACAYCGSADSLEVDHIIPYSKGGAHEEFNFQCLCKKCNRKKYNRLEGEHNG